MMKSIWLVIHIIAIVYECISAKNEQDNLQIPIMDD